MATQDNMTPVDTATPIDAVHAEFAAATQAHDQAMAAVERYSSLVGRPVQITLASSGSVITSNLTACYAEGCLHMPDGQDAPVFLPWSAIEDIQPA
jgi:hypothetical protein